MKSTRRPIPLVVALIVTAAACGTGDPHSAGRGRIDAGSSGGPDGAWALSAATVDGAALDLDDRYRVTMTIDGSRVGGTAACNGYGGALTTAGGSFAVGDIAQTEMACEPAVMEIESAFLQGLLRVSAVARSGDVLSLTGDGVELTFDLLPPVPTAALVGLTWVLDAIIDGETASSTIATAEPATLLLSPDGTFVGSTGCRGLAGEYVLSGDTVQFTSFSADGECPAEIARQDGRIISVLESGFTATIDGTRLTLTAPGGEGLSYTAAR